MNKESSDRIASKGDKEDERRTKQRERKKGAPHTHAGVKRNLNQLEGGAAAGKEKRRVKNRFYMCCACPSLSLSLAALVAYESLSLRVEVEVLPGQCGAAAGAAEAGQVVRQHAGGGARVAGAHTDRRHREAHAGTTGVSMSTAPEEE